MKISEIVNTFPREEFLDSYHYLFDGCPRIPAANGDLLYSNAEKTNFSDEAFGLFTIDDELVALLTCNNDRLEKMQITKTASSPQWRQQGCMRYLINAAVKKYGELFSDDHQTPEAKAMWEQLIKLPGGTLKIKLYDAVNGEIVNIDKDNIDSIWNDSENVLVAQRVNTTIDESSNKRNILHRRINSGRDYNSLWFFVHDKNNP